MQESFATRGWYGRYILRRDELVYLKKDRTELERVFQAPSRDHSLYKSVQPTGLMYGHPVNISNARNSLIASLADRDRMKVILAESFITNSLLSRYHFITNEHDFNLVLDDSTIGVAEFYRQLYPAFRKKLGEFIIRKNDFHQLAEFVITNRVLYARPKRYNNNFWTRFFSNSLLFLDVFYYGEWMLSDDRKLFSEMIRLEKESMRRKILQVIGAAAFADGNLETEEKKLFDHFLKSADFSINSRKEIREQFFQGIKIEDIDLSIDNWILKRYLLEIAILTVWSDKQVLDSEKLFLKKLTVALGFTTDDLDNATLAIESFIIDHWNEVHYLQGTSFNLLGERYGERVGFIMEMNADQLKQDIFRNKYLVNNIDRYFSGKLSSNEEYKTKVLMINILKRIPSFNIISLPSNYLNLDNILNKLPEECRP